MYRFKLNILTHDKYLTKAKKAVYLNSTFVSDLSTGYTTTLTFVKKKPKFNLSKSFTVVNTSIELCHTK